MYQVHCVESLSLIERGLLTKHQRKGHHELGVLSIALLPYVHSIFDNGNWWDDLGNQKGIENSLVLSIQLKKIVQSGSYPQLRAKGKKNKIFESTSYRKKHLFISCHGAFGGSSLAISLAYMEHYMGSPGFDLAAWTCHWSCHVLPSLVHCHHSHPHLQAKVPWKHWPRNGVLTSRLGDSKWFKWGNSWLENGPEMKD